MNKIFYSCLFVYGVNKKTESVLSVRVGNYFSYACVYTYVNAFFTII